MLSLPLSTPIHADLPVENAYPASTAFPLCLYSPVFFHGPESPPISLNQPLPYSPIPFIAISSSCRFKWRCVYNRQLMSLFQSEMRTLHSSALHSVLLSYKLLAEEEEREIRPALLVLILLSVQWHNAYMQPIPHITYRFIDLSHRLSPLSLVSTNPFYRNTETVEPIPLLFAFHFDFEFHHRKNTFLLYKKAMCARRFVRADSLQNGRN